MKILKAINFVILALIAWCVCSVLNWIFPMLRLGEQTAPWLIKTINFLDMHLFTFVNTGIFIALIWFFIVLYKQREIFFAE